VAARAGFEPMTLR